MPVVKSEFACPTCEQQTGSMNQIYANAGELQCSANGAHKWNDVPSFMGLNPKMVFKVTMAVMPQEGHGPLTVSIPLKMIEKLKAKFGDKLSATAATTFGDMLEGDSMLVPELDLQRITEKLGKRPKHSSELYGMIYAAMESVNDMRAERDSAVSDLKAYESRSPGSIVLNLGAHWNTAKAKAEEENKPVKMWVEDKIKEFFDNGWI